MVGNNFGPCASRGFITAGAYPINFFVLNPNIFGGTSPTGTPSATLLSDNSFSNYTALQVELRKRYSHGLTLNVNYTWSHSLTDRYNKNVDNISNFATLRNRALDRGPSPFDSPRLPGSAPSAAFSRYGCCPVCFAQQQGWTVSSITPLPTGLPFAGGGRLTVNQQDAGVVSLVARELGSNVGVSHRKPVRTSSTPN
jgi:hypothetical protein